MKRRSLPDRRADVLVIMRYVSLALICVAIIVLLLDVTGKRVKQDYSRRTAADRFDLINDWPLGMNSSLTSVQQERLAMLDVSCFAVSDGQSINVIAGQCLEPLEAAQTTSVGTEILSHHWGAPPGTRTIVRVTGPVLRSSNAPVLIAELDLTDAVFAARDSMSPLMLIAPVTAGLAFFIFIVSQITLMSRDRSRQLRMLRAETTDALTGLPNRKNTRHTLEQAMREVRPTREEVGVIILDIDGFSRLNATLGPDNADEVLIYLAQGLSNRIRKSDVIGRIGPDQFLVILRDCPVGDLSRRADDLHHFTSRPIPVAGNTVSVSISMGVTNLSRCDQAVAVIHEAMLALKEAKRRGGDLCLEWAPDLAATDAREKEILALLQDSSGDSPVWLALQPIVSTAGGSFDVMGYEALMRLEAPTGEVIMPGEFIPIAEESGDIARLGLMAIRRAAEALGRLPAPLFVSVNLSAVQFRSGTLAQDIEDILTTSGIDPSRLELEITESLLLSDGDNVPAQLAEIRSLGVRLALDDFGTGHSNLGYLWKFQFDKLKIDRAFLEGYEFNQTKHREIIETILVLGKKLGLATTVEGVETSEHADLVRLLGSDQAQGYFFGRPAPSKDILASYDDAAGPKLRII